MKHQNITGFDQILMHLLVLIIVVVFVIMSRPQISPLMLSEFM